MKDFVKLWYQLTFASNDHLKITYLNHFFQESRDVEKKAFLQLALSKSPRKITNFQELQAWFFAFIPIPNWLYESASALTIDRNESLSLLLPPPRRRLSHSLAEILALIEEWRTHSTLEKRRNIQHLWEEMNAKEIYLFNRLICGTFSSPVSSSILIRSLALHFERNEQEIAICLESISQLHTESFNDLFHPNFDLAPILPQPLGPIYRVDTTEIPASLKNIWLEKTFGGHRVQVIIANEKLWIWNEEGTIQSSTFPEFQALIDLLPEGTHLIGEILPKEYKSEKILSYLQQRISKKRPSRKTLENFPLVFLAQDVFRLGSKTFFDVSTNERKQILDEHIDEIPEGPVFVSKTNHLFMDSTSFLVHLEENPILHGEFLFTDNHPRIDKPWYTWKKKDKSLLAVLIYFERRSRRSKDTLYTFAIKNDENQELVPIHKSSLTLSAEEQKDLDTYMKYNVIERFGPVRSIRASLVYEIQFGAVSISKRKKAGLQLHDAKVLGPRPLRNLEEITNLSTLRLDIE